MTRKVKFIAAAALVCGLMTGAYIAAAQIAAVEDYDVVILNGRVMDPETTFDGVRNVGIKDGTIVAIQIRSLARSLCAMA